MGFADDVMEGSLPIPGPFSFVVEPLAPPPFVKKLLDGSKEAQSATLSKKFSRSCNRYVAAGPKLSSTGGLANKLQSAKHVEPPSVSRLGESPMYIWFQRQCDDLIAKRYQGKENDTTSASLSPEWGRKVSITTALNENDYMCKPSSSPGTSSSEGGGSLDLIFSFYAKLQKPGVQKMKRALTFKEIDQANTTLSFFEFLCALRDFDVVPNLVTKPDVLSIWKHCKAKRGRRATPETVISELQFEDFLEILVHISLVAFQRPGISIASNEECVEGLVKFMRLNDHKHALHVIRTRGCETSSRFNYRSKGETDPLGGKRLRKERDMARAATLISHAMHAIKIDEVGEGSDVGEVSFGRGTASSSKFIGDDTRFVWEKQRRSVISGSSTIGGDRHVGLEDCEGTELETMLSQVRTTSADGADVGMTKGGSRRGGAGTVKTLNTTTTLGTSFWGGESKVSARTLGVDHTQMFDNYDHRLTELLRCHKNRVGKEGRLSWKECNGPFLDFGIVSSYREDKTYRAIISLVNASKEPILITPETYRLDKNGERGGFEPGTLDVVFVPSVVPPGLRTVLTAVVGTGLLGKDRSALEILGGINLVISTVPRQQGKKERENVHITTMRVSSELTKNVTVKIPLYMHIVKQKFADKIGDYTAKAQLKDNPQARRSFKMKTRKDKLGETM